jgi:hypothetical protein
MKLAALKEMKNSLKFYGKKGINSWQKCFGLTLTKPSTNWICHTKTTSDAWALQEGASTLVDGANHPKGDPAPLMRRPISPHCNSWRTSSGISKKQFQK